MVNFLEKYLFSYCFLRLLALRNVLNDEEDQICIPVLIVDLAGVENHRLTPDTRELMVKLQALEPGIGGENPSQQCPQIGNVPLVISQLVYESSLRLF